MPSSSKGLFTYDTVKEVCFDLKDGVAGGPDMTIYDHIQFGGPVLWDILSTLFATMFSWVKVPSQFKTELILPLLKGKGLEAHNKDNYCSIAMFSVLRSIKVRFSLIVAHFRPEIFYWLVQKIRSLSPQNQQSYNFMIKSN